MAALMTRDRDGAYCDFLSLRVENPNVVVPYIEIITRPNVDGQAYRKLAKKSKPFHIIGIRNFGSMYYARRAPIEAARALVGELCTATTLEACTYERIMVLDVTQRDVFQVLTLNGGLGVSTGGIIPNASVSAKPAIAVIDFLVQYAGDES